MLNCVSPVINYHNEELKATQACQQYRLDNYKVNCYLLETYIGSDIVINQIPNVLNQAVIGINQCFNEGKWDKQEQFFLALADNLLQSLINMRLVSYEAKKRIWLTNTNGVIDAEIDVGDNKTDKLSEDALRWICEQIGIEWNSNSTLGKTTGRVGKFSFELDHPNPLSLDPNKILKALKGESDNPFIFHVVVHNKEQA